MNMIKVRIISSLQEDRYRKHTGKLYSDVDEIKQLVSNADDLMTDYAFSMLKIPKIGINPQTAYNTPAGLYCYPLFPMQFDELLTDKLPFVSDSPYVGLVKLNKSAKWLMPGDSWIKGNFSEEEYLQFRNKLAESVTSTPYERLDSVEIQEWNEVIAKEVAKLRNHRKNNMNWDAKIFDLAYYFAKESKPFPKKKTGSNKYLMDDDGNFYTKEETQKSRDTTIKFRSFLVNVAGVDAVFDRGYEIVHESEPYQVVFLTTKAYSPIKVFKTKNLRKVDKPIAKSPNLRIFYQYIKMCKEAYKKELALANKKLERSIYIVKIRQDGKLISYLQPRKDGPMTMKIDGSWRFEYSARLRNSERTFVAGKLPNDSYFGRQDFDDFLIDNNIESVEELWNLVGWETPTE